jgi:circadian clock protein KaiC
MTLDDRSPAARLERLPSGIPGLDTVLDGGFLRSGVYILQGQPGSGKTLFANQLCYRHAADGGHAVYVTLLAESHARMLQHLRSMSFFDESAIPNRVSYISAFHDLESEGLKGLMGVLRREMRARHATVLVLDGLVAAAEAAQTDRELKKFVHEVQTSAVFHNCTVFLLTSGTPQRTQAEHTMVDGLIELEDRLFDARAERALQVRKFRGSGVLRGKHPLRISGDGLQVFPRIESLFNAPPEPQATEQVMTSGVASFDALLRGGGIPAHSATVVIGSSGTGKTTFGLHYLGASSDAEPGLMFSFFEAPHRLRAKARSFGIDLEGLERSGAVELMWRSQGEHVLDELAHHLLRAVKRRRVNRLVIDGIGGFFESSVYPERTTRFFSCLTNELRREGVTVLITMETMDVVGSTISTPFGVSGFVDNLVFLRFSESGGHIRRLLTITKMRDADYQPGLHLLEIGNGGMHVGGLYSLDGDIIPQARPMDA